MPIGLYSCIGFAVGFPASSTPVLNGPEVELSVAAPRYRGATLRGGLPFGRIGQRALHNEGHFWVIAEPVERDAEQEGPDARPR